MNINQTIYDEIKKNNNMITTSQVLSLGYSKQLLTNYVKEGLLERCRHGVYTLPTAVHDDMYTLMLRSDKIVFSHDTALFLNELSERTPFMHTVTIPSNAALPNSLKGECLCFYVKPELHDIGIIEKSTTFGNTVRCYNIERTICDFLRCRNRCDEETVISAIKNYAIYDKKHLNLLSVYAKQFKVGKELKKYLEVLL
ncbi:type IV toxin-antitoxin system AbiEi family antitoxin domain-containing protein [Diplocloster modestus]|uniref:Type IV toxin-antitoxin system AbiEi family antitoxin domain-containing protein n=1 Tax=Diplocloster modestus TaxID=2850322 RepID=A0ABS6K4U0_9FIRM|nr:type IV toxin-antitoxin system AbiEi family antitoxin domain-containing protein [Diplocloster modestus]MBU9725513.1 type IV toxin-antitoxin system AbiEi family antitoxin domain-containing protein [Diplocloster modestus]